MPEPPVSVPIPVEPPHPELDRRAAVAPLSNQIGQFLDWLSDEHHVVRCVWDDEVQQYMPLNRSVSDLLHQYFDIDRDKCERETDAVLQYVRSMHAYQEALREPAPPQGESHDTGS
jgi:hypothetical protein